MLIDRIIDLPKFCVDECQTYINVLRMLVQTLTTC